ncbi:MAG: type II toxin-antitoxin system HicB family antitoxin [Prevotellaceae bacterium]|nr:type II toxin-antitoxin system HicB family antitoxin [Prevotellaceae bacterium]
MELLPGCVAVGDTLDEVKKNIRTSIDMHLVGMRKDRQPVPVEFRTNYQLCFKLNAQALLHSCENIVTQRALARAAGISHKQINHYYTGYRNPRPEQRVKIISGLHKLAHELLAAE